MTAAERKHLSRVAALGCIVCWLSGVEDCPCEIHHIKVGITGVALKASHFRTLGLCPPHHRFADGTAAWQYEIGYHVSPEEFELRYGTQGDLLRITVERLGESANDPKYQLQEIAA